MCGRYYIDDEIDEDELQAIFDEINRKYPEIKDDKSMKLSGEIYPTNIVPINANNKCLSPTPYMMKWGFTAPWDDKKQVINARSETASSKAMFKESMLKHRCLIPATNYFEWQKTSEGKIKRSIKPLGSTLMYMAGIYRLEDKKSVFTILTRSPAPMISFIHDRMPVILPKEAVGDWLNIDYIADDVIKAALLDIDYKIS